MRNFFWNQWKEMAIAQDTQRSIVEPYYVAQQVVETCGMDPSDINSSLYSQELKLPDSTVTDTGHPTTYPSPLSKQTWTQGLKIHFGPVWCWEDRGKLVQLKEWCKPVSQKGNSLGGFMGWWVEDPHTQQSSLTQSLAGRAVGWWFGLSFPSKSSSGLTHPVLLHTLIFR